MINKKYSLPAMVIAKLVEHFSRCTAVPGPLPIAWHQSLLALAQRYRGDIDASQKEALRVTMQTHAHHAITPEIRRELFAVAPAPPAAAAAAFGGGGGGGGGASAASSSFAASPFAAPHSHGAFAAAGGAGGGGGGAAAAAAASARPAGGRKGGKKEKNEMEY